MINTVDIIIPVYRPRETFRSLLGMLMAQKRPADRIILINTLPEEGDNACEVEALVRGIIRDTDRYILKHITKSEFDHAGTRRMAVGLSDADAFVCMTDDAVPADSYLIGRLIGSLESDARTAMAYARQLPRRGARASERFQRAFNYPAKSRRKSIEDISTLGIKTFFASNVCCAYRRSIYDELGGFTEDAVFNEDMVYAGTALKKGYFTYYNADAAVIHSHSYTPIQELRRNFDNGMSQAMHPEIFEGIRSESEGIRMVSDTVKYLAGSGNSLEVPGFIMRSAGKYAGFRLGRAYRKLPGRMVLWLSMNRDYVRKHICREQT